MRIFFIKVSKILIVSALIFILVALFIFYENYDSLIILPDDDNLIFISSFLEILQILNLLFLLTLLLFISNSFLLLFKKFLSEKDAIHQEIFLLKNIERAPPIYTFYK